MRAARFDDQMDVVPLDGELGHADVAAVAEVAERAVDHGERALAAEVPDVVGRSQRHVDGLVRAEVLARTVWKRRARSNGLSAGPRAPAAPGAELERPLMRRRHDAHRIARV
jgi:hypothetical protein